MRIKIPDFRNGFSGNDEERLKAKEINEWLRVKQGRDFPLTAGTGLCSILVHVPVSP